MAGARDTSTSGPGPRGRSAVVIGGSVAGLCAARALAERVDAVTVVERDADAAAGGAGPSAIARPGTPQGRHFHLLLARGCQELERLFPGFTATMVRRGAQRIDLARDVASLRPEGWLAHDRPSVEVLLASRGLTERVVRELLATRANVRFSPRTEVDGLLVDAAQPRRVCGVRARSRADQGEHELRADLVVDASGRRSRAPAWFAALGLPAPAETVVDGHAGYSTRWFAAPEPGEWPAGWWWKAAWVQHDEHTIALLFPVEEGQWVMTLVGLAGRHPPTDEGAFMAALAGLRSPIVARMLRLARPVSGVFGHRDLTNRLRHYGRWAAAPEGFIAVGDAACALNPVHGQGMTTATLSAGVLADVLGRGDLRAAGVARRFFAAQARMLRDPWQLAVGADFRLPGSDGPRPFGIGAVHRYMDALIRAAMTHHDLRVVLDRVLNMVSPPRLLFSPRIAVRVAAHALRRPPAELPPGAAPEMPPGAAVDAASGALV